MAGNFMSRRGVEISSFTLHPAGIAHGPHPAVVIGPNGTTTPGGNDLHADALGRVRVRFPWHPPDESGDPLADVPVELWVKGSGAVPIEFRSTHGRLVSDEVVRLDQGPLKTGPQGALQTPSTLLSGSTYRVSIRRDGFAPFVSDWVKLDGERATIPTIRLLPLQKLTGRIEDRQRHPVAGAQVFLPAGGPRAATDARGDLR